MARKKVSHRAASHQPTTEENKKPSNVLEFPAGGATLPPVRPCPEPGVVESRAPKKKNGKVLEIVPKVIRVEEMLELFDLYTQMKGAVEKYLQKDRWIGAALLAGATVEGNNKATKLAREFVMTYKKSTRNPDPVADLKLAMLQNL